MKTLTGTGKSRLGRNFGRKTIQTEFSKSRQGWNIKRKTFDLHTKYI